MNEREIVKFRLSLDMYDGVYFLLFSLIFVIFKLFNIY